MKKVLIILAFTLLPLIAIAQASNEDIKNNDTIEIVIEKTLETKDVTVSNSAMKAKVLKINRKKREQQGADRDAQK